MLIFGHSGPLFIDFCYKPYLAFVVTDSDLDHLGVLAVIKELLGFQDSVGKDE